MTFIELLKEIAEADKMVAEVVKPKADNNIRNLIIGVGAVIQGNIVYYDIQIKMDNTDFFIDNPMKARTVL